MRSIFSILFLSVLTLLGCSKEKTESGKDYSGNRYALLQVDYQTFEFEGGREFIFDEEINDFTIHGEYQSPGDFGWVKLYWMELDTLIFNGAIVWAGTGQRNYPEDLESDTDFSTLDEPLTIPDESLFNGTFEGAPTTEFTETERNNVWNAISQLELVQSYRETNPTGKINLFLYRASVGDGNPADWDWLVFLKN